MCSRVSVLAVGLTGWRVPLRAPCLPRVWFLARVCYDVGVAAIFTW